MSASDPELRDYLATVRKVVNDHAAPVLLLDSPDSVAELIDAVRRAGALDLARDTATMAESLSWLAATVTETATVSGSVAFALAAHYTAERAAARRDVSVPSTGTAGILVDAVPSAADERFLTAVVPTVLHPSVVALFEADGGRCVLVPPPPPTAASDVDKEGGFSGLRGARLREVRIVDDRCAGQDDPAVGAAARDWAVMCSAVLVGIARGATRSAEAYAGQRRQFGSALTSFAAIRGLLAQMYVAVEGVDALLDRAARADATDAECWQVSSEAGRVAVAVALDAIQVHGGYGYVEDYPVAGRLRDALSVQARSGGRRAALSRLGRRTLGPAAWELG